MKSMQLPGFVALAATSVLLLYCPATGRQAAAGTVGSGEAEEEDPFAKEERAAPPIADPIQPVNRGFFVFNDKLYFWVMKPVSTGYGFVLPRIARIGVRNFFSNVGTPVRTVNCLFQGDLRGTGTELARFGVNTTVGVAGLADPAKGWLKLKKRDEDFGQTLGVWGLGTGLYLNWPLMGPSSLRDTVAMPVNAVLDPTTFVPGAGLVQRINHVSLNIGEYEDLKAAALDPYIAVRDAYNQYRCHAIKERR